MAKKKTDAANPFSAASAEADVTRKTQNDLATGVGSTSRSNSDLRFSDDLVTANFKIPRSARKKLKEYAVKNDTTAVALLLEWIASLPD